jgi:hypothetical protein
MKIKKIKINNKLDMELSKKKRDKAGALCE